MIKVNIVEDDKVIRESLVQFLNMQEDIQTNVVSYSIEDYLMQHNHPKEEADIVLLDIGLPGISGIEGIPRIKEINPNLDIIMLTTYEEVQIIVKSLCLGACSYISKKTSLKDIVEAIRVVKFGGSYMSPSVAREIVSYVIGGRVSRASILTERQREILGMLAEGKRNNEIAEMLSLSIETIKSHIKNMYSVLHVNNRSEAVAKYLRGEIH